MAELPSGTVTFLFTDIEGSTDLVKRLGDDYGDVLATHRRLLRAAFAEQGGQEMGTEGDAFFYWFPRVRQAVKAAAEAQRALAQYPWPDGGAVRVRMGMHTGEPEVVDSEIVGMGVHRVARVCSAAHGGQVLLSFAAAGVVDDEKIAGVGLRDLGDYWLKDIDRPERLFQLEIEGTPSDFPPVRAKAAAAEAAPKPAFPGRALIAPLVAVVVLGAGAAAGAVVLTGGGSEAASASPPARTPGAPARPTPPDRAKTYVRRLDQLLASSQATLALVKTYVSDVQSSVLAGDAARTRVHGFTLQRRSMLGEARELKPPAAFAHAHSRFLRSLRVSIDDDLALEDWAEHYRAGDASAAAADLRRVVTLGGRASAEKAAFLAEYGAVRARLSGRSPSSLPASY